MVTSETPDGLQEATSPEAERSDLEERLLRCLRQRIDENAPAAVEPFLQRLLGLPEATMRARRFTERLQDSDPRLGLALLQGLMDLSLSQDKKARAILLDLSTARPLAEALGYAASRKLYQLARERANDRVAELFLTPEGPGSTKTGAKKDKENEKLPDESLGWRKRLARGPDRLKLDRLLFDRNPAVIALLLDNPRLVERDVIRIAAMRPTSGTCLDVVFRHPKWSRRYRVKVALAANPYCPVDIALACVPHLMAEQLRYVASSERLAQSVRETAQEVLDRRRLKAQLEAPSVHRLDGADGHQLSADESGPGSAGEDEGEGEGEGEVDLNAIARELENWMA